MQTTLSLFLFYLAIKILKRKFNHITLTLSAFYIFPGMGFLLNLIQMLLSTTILGYILYFVAAFLILFGFIFLLIFINYFNKINSTFISKRSKIIIFAYGISILLLLNFPGGININENTNWTPVYSWLFLIIIYIFFTFSIFIPSIILWIMAYKKFEDNLLKRRFKFLIIGIIEMFIAFYGLILYNTWDNPIFKSIWTFMVFLIVIPSEFLIYYGIGKNL